MGLKEQLNLIKENIGIKKGPEKIIHDISTRNGQITTIQTNELKNATPQRHKLNIATTSHPYHVTLESTETGELNVIGCRTDNIHSYRITTFDYEGKKASEIRKVASNPIRQQNVTLNGTPLELCFSGIGYDHMDVVLQYNPSSELITLFEKK